MSVLKKILANRNVKEVHYIDEENLGFGGTGAMGRDVDHIAKSFS